MEIKRVVPILRSFDEAQTRAFYLDYLGGTIAFEHRFYDGAPLYLGVRLGGAELHLSEHHGDATPVSAIRLEIENVREFRQTITDRGYRNATPAVVIQDWGFDELMLKDPAQNRIVFCTPHASDDAMIPDRSTD